MPAAREGVPLFSLREGGWKRRHVTADLIPSIFLYALHVLLQALRSAAPGVRLCLACLHFLRLAQVVAIEGEETRAIFV